VIFVALDPFLLQNFLELLVPIGQTILVTGFGGHGDQSHDGSDSDGADHESLELFGVINGMRVAIVLLLNIIIIVVPNLVDIELASAPCGGRIIPIAQQRFPPLHGGIVLAAKSNHGRAVANCQIAVLDLGRAANPARYTAAARRGEAIARHVHFQVLAAVDEIPVGVDDARRALREVVDAVLGTVVRTVVAIAASSEIGG